MNNQLLSWFQVLIGTVQLVRMLFQLRVKNSRPRRRRRLRYWKGLGIEYIRYDDDHQR